MFRQSGAYDYRRFDVSDIRIPVLTCGFERAEEKLCHRFLLGDDCCMTEVARRETLISHGDLYDPKPVNEIQPTGFAPWDLALGGHRSCGRPSITGHGFDDCRGPSEYPQRCSHRGCR